VPASLRYDTAGANLKIYRLTSITENLQTVTSGYTELSDKDGSWSVPLLSGKSYAVWWDHSVDFRNLTISLPKYNDSTDSGIIVRFNYTENKEIIEIGRAVLGVLQMPLINSSSSALTAATCNFGDYYHDASNKYISVCLTDKNRGSHS